ncbi:signal peptidase II [Clostridium muellerianum]|uniref:signal peptidase II n=1 Tax=Clostridium muellerianum TaxID=2716538 RepID=UPI001FABAF1C|nr:signal peptidase II [Clostridium muellerianum]
MSEFFNVTLNDVLLDDSVISNRTGWTSEKIYREMINKRITKFEELEDVDVVNKKNNQLLAYSESKRKFITIDAIEAGQIIVTGLRQISKTGIVGSPEKPEIVNIPINTTDFKVPSVNILKYNLGTQDIIVTKNEFISGEANDFIQDNMVVFDGKAHLKTEHNYKFQVERELETKIEYSVHFEKSDFKRVEEFSTFEHGVTENLKVIAIPYDRLLIPTGDMNLSNVEHIDYFKLTANSKNLKVVCSVDGGTIWKTFKGEKWINVNLDTESVRVKGMDIDEFNKINDVFWNELITTKKIRFAYLLAMDTPQDIEEIDNLDLKYDGEGKWIQAKEDTFDVIYASNTLLQVYVKFSGDIKINYQEDNEGLSIYENHWTKECFKGVNLLTDIKDIFVSNKYHAISNSEFTIKNNIDSVDKETDIKPENQLHLVITDNNITILDVFILPQNTQKYILGISPNLKVFIKGQFDANLYMTVC